MTGEKFLDKIFKDLYLSDEVLHTSLKSNTKYENIKAYMERLERIHGKATTEHRKNLIKRLYYDKYVIKENSIPNGMDKNKIITDQANSLERWLDYLTNDNIKWPMWIKYWVFQGVLKIGTYDEAHDVYMKRSKKTTAPFIDVNPEVLNKCINIVLKYVKESDIDDIELKKLVESGSFVKLYEKFEKIYRDNIANNSDKFDGIWKVYRMESEQIALQKEKNGEIPEYLRLYNSLKNRSTGWYTGISLQSAKTQICGGSNLFRDYKGGDFYCYFTKDKNGEYKIPRIAIRMEGHNKIAEIRGIDVSQNLELGLEDVVEDKLKEMNFLTKEDVLNYLKIIENMKKITLLNKKFARGEEFSVDELKFIYQLDGPVKNFGLFGDNRLENIANSIDDKMVYDKLDFEYKVKFIISLSKKFRLAKFNKKEFKIKDKEVLLQAIASYFNSIEYADPILFDDREFMLKAIKICDQSFTRASLKLKKDKKFILEAIKTNYFVYYYLDNEVLTDDSFKKKATLYQKWAKFQDGVSNLVGKKDRVK